MNDEKILIDTSVWIKYLRDKTTNLSRKVEEILSKQAVYVPTIVIAELIQGSKTEREVSIIEEFIDAFNIIDQKADTWIEAGRLSFKMKKKGKTINLADCYIAVIAKEHDCSIFTLDKHFNDIRGNFQIRLVDSNAD